MMNVLKTGESFQDNGYTITRLGAGLEESKSDWALFCLAMGSCSTCEDGSCTTRGEGKCDCDKQHVHFWVKTGHSFSAGPQSYKLEASSREESSVSDGDDSKTGGGDC